MSNSQQTVPLHTWFRSPLKDGDAPLPMVFSLRDSDRELIHAVSGQGVYHQSPLGAVLVLPACWLTLFSVPNCVGSKLRGNWHVLFHWRGLAFSLTQSLFVFNSLPFPLYHLNRCTHFNRSHLDTPGLTFPISTAGSTQEMRTDWGDMTLTLMSWASYSGGSGQHTQTHAKTWRQKCL